MPFALPWRTARIACAFATPWLLVACGGGSDGVPAQPAAITCPDAATALTRATVQHNGVEREYFVHVPSNTEQLKALDARAIATVVAFHDAGATATTTAQASCWHRVGESRGFVTLLPSALGGQWNTTADAGRGDDAEFVRAALADMRTRYALSTSNMVYATGSGQGGAMAQLMAMRSPVNLPAVASIRGTADAAVFSLPAGALPTTAMSAWVLRDAGALSAKELQQVAYWNRLNGAGDATVQDGTDFSRTTYAAADNPRHQLTLADFKQAGFAGQALSERIWDEMFAPMVRFNDDTAVNGSVQVQQTAAQMGLTDTTLEIAGTPRRWLTYLPKNYAALTAGGKTLPLALSFHGRNGSARWQAQISRWHEVAEARGFIVVYPQGLNATWTTGIAADNPDVPFALGLIDELRRRHAVDATRIYLNGSSQGTALVNRIAVQHPQLFAAIAPCYSGHRSAASYANAIVRTDVPLPVWQCRGGDELPTEFPGGTAGETAARSFWRETVNRNFGPPTLVVDGRNRIEIWNDGLAEYRWQVTDRVPHFWHPGQAQRMWDEMLSRYSRAANGALVRQ